MPKIALIGSGSTVLPNAWSGWHFAHSRAYRRYTYRSAWYWWG